MYKTIPGEVKVVKLPGVERKESMFCIRPNQLPGSLSMLVQGKKAAVMAHPTNDCTPQFHLMDDTTVVFPCHKCWSNNGANIVDWMELIRFYLIQNQGFESIALTYDEAKEILDLTQVVGAK